MAKGKSVHLGSKHFFSLVVLSVTALGLMFVTYASQQNTNTESDAAGCNEKPIFKPDGTNSGDKYVTYIYKVTNPCNKKYNYGFHVGAPSSWYVEYKKNNGSWESKYSSPFLYATLNASGTAGDTHTVRARVSPPTNAANKTYRFDARACNAFGLGDGAEMGKNCAVRSVTYVKTNEAPPTPTPTKRPTPTPTPRP